MAKSQRYQTYMARFDRNGNHRGNDFPRRVLDEYAQRGPSTTAAGKSAATS